MPAIISSDLSKTYRVPVKRPGLAAAFTSLVRKRTVDREAVAGVSFSIEPGEIVGFLGPNGAGKTTTLKMLTGLLYPSAGSAEVLGFRPQHRRREFLRRISLVMGQKAMLWWDVPAMDSFLLLRDIYRLDKDTFRSSIDELTELLDVGNLLETQIRRLSLGERMKMELMGALLHRPDVLFLDEPTIGLDVVSQQRVREFLRNLNAVRGTTILLTSHYMDDIEALCPRVLLIDHGRLRFDGALNELIARTAPSKVVTAVLSEPVVVEGNESDDPRRVHLTVPRAAVAGITARLLESGAVIDLSIEELPIDDVIRKAFEAAP